jgi:hypothetical protein
MLRHIARGKLCPGTRSAYEQAYQAAGGSKVTGITAGQRHRVQEEVICRDGPRQI